MRFMRTESVLQTKNRSGPAKNRFSVALLTMEKWCLHASSLIFYRIIIKVAGNQDRHESLVEFDFGPNQSYLELLALE